MPEVWDPRETPRRLTMFEEPEGAPFVLAYCEPRFWDGFYVPVLSLQLLAFHWGQCAATDPNGEWWSTVPRLGCDWSDWVARHPAHLDEVDYSANDVVVIPHHDGDPSLALIYEPVGKVEGILQYAFDRLPWKDAT